MLICLKDNDINRKILAKRLELDGHIVVNTTNGQEGVDEVVRDQEFDCILMDVQCVYSSLLSRRVLIKVHQDANPQRP